MQLLSVIIGSLLFSGLDAINIHVSPEGGNDTSPLQYGLMFEVNQIP